MAKLDFYTKEIEKIQEDLLGRISILVRGLTQVSNVELLNIVKQIDFFTEMEQLGYSTLLSKTSKTYDREISKVFSELSRRELEKVPALSVDVLRELKDFELTYLTGQARQYSNQLRNAMLRGIITGQTNQQIMSSLTTSFGVGTFISSSETSFLINDAFSRFSNAVRAKAYEEFPDIKFKYVGSNDDKTRDVCKRALKEEPLTRKEIDRLGYVDFTNRGGYNCRHDWVRVR